MKRNKAMTFQDIPAQRPNRDLRDEIKEYWSDRAATFDNDQGHKIADGAERAAWIALFQRHLGAARGRKLLDLASGTGEIAILCHDLGYRVTGLDWAEPMLARARAKAQSQGADIPFLQADAERTMLPAASQQVIVTRHLVWTLVDPVAAFAEWFRVLAPGGQLLIIDGDFVGQSSLQNLLRRLIALGGHTDRGMTTRHADILGRVYFSGGAKADAIAQLLRAAGFEMLTIDTRLGSIHRAQAEQFGWRRSLLRRTEHRYVVSAYKPV